MVFQAVVLYLAPDRSDPELFGQVGSGSGIIVTDPDLNFMTTKSVLFLQIFLHTPMVQFVFGYICYVENL
jgi:hypothetical protein